jgi:nicotinamide-nucleotide amidase
MTIEILSVGTELLLGDIVNTNARFLARELAALGVVVRRQTVVGDNMERILSALETALSLADAVIATGGLGPTDDDITKEAAARFFGLRLLLDEDTLNSIKTYFEMIGATMTGNNVKQSLAPEGAVVLSNDKGVAPGLIIEKDGKAIILLPGPPQEMEPMFTVRVAPYFREKSGLTFVSRTLRLCGIGESAAETAVGDLIKCQSNPTIAPYAKSGEMIFRLTARAGDASEAEILIKPAADEIYARLGAYIYGEGEAGLAETVVKLLSRAGVTVAVAESCTGGLLAAAITDISGASSILLEGAVVYSNGAKRRRLGVKAETIDTYGAVSEQTASEMARGVAESSAADMGVGITGVAGPTGETDEKPVGLVYVCLYFRGALSVVKLRLAGDRARVRRAAVTAALNLIRKALLKES